MPLVNGAVSEEVVESDVNAGADETVTQPPAEGSSGPELEECVVHDEFDFLTSSATLLPHVNIPQ